jgi:hypothetical protein
MHALLRGRDFHDPQLIASRSDSASAQQLGDAFALDRLAGVIALRVLATGGDEKFCLRVTYKCRERDESSFRWLWRDKSGNGGLNKTQSDAPRRQSRIGV